MRTKFDKNPFKIFLSYTSREAEIKEIQPFVDGYCRSLWEEFKKHNIDVFYDHFSLDQNKIYMDHELTDILVQSIDDSHFFVAFLSPSYFESHWCLGERGRAWRSKKKPRGGACIHEIYWKPIIYDDYPSGRRKTSILCMRRDNFTNVTYAWDRGWELEVESAVRVVTEKSISLVKRSFPNVFER